MKRIVIPVLLVVLILVVTLLWTHRSSCDTTVTDTFDRYGYDPQRYETLSFPPTPDRIQAFTRPHWIHTFAYFTLSHTRDRNGADIFVVSNNSPAFLDRFVTQMPQLRRPFKLVLCHGDYGVVAFGERIDRVLAHPLAVAVYAVDCDRVHPRLVPIPIGLDYHTLFFEQSIAPIHQDERIRAVYDTLPAATNRSLSVYVNSHLNYSDTHPKHAYPNGRQRTFELFHSNPLFAFETKKQTREQVWRQHGEHLFILSPPGNGLDCHRTWEALALGNLPIVQRSPMDALFDDLPVIRVDHWEEITPENLRRWRAQYLPFDPKRLNRLTAQYWLDRIRDDTFTPKGNHYSAL